MTTHRIEISSARRRSGSGGWTGHGSSYAEYQGERIGEFRVPECDAARWLLANGKAVETDTLVTTRNGRPAMTGAVGWLADHTVTENEKVSPRFAKWRPFSMAASDRPATVCGSAQDGQEFDFGSICTPGLQTGPARAMTRHHIRLNGNRVTGAVSLVSPEPVKAAATELLARGASPEDTLHVDAGEVNISPMTLGKIAAPRITPNRHAWLREMLGLPPTR